MADSQPSGGNPPSNTVKDTGFIPGDDSWTQWRNIFSILAGQMTNEGKEQFRVARDIRNETADCKRCEDQRDFLLKYSESCLCSWNRLDASPSYQASQPAHAILTWHSQKKGPTITFLRQNISQLGGDISSHNIHCRRCTSRQAGGFDPDYGIQICANEMRDQGHLEDTMAHEMVHAFDHMRFKLDWRDNLRHAACAEVR